MLERNEAYERLEESQNSLNAELAEAGQYVRSLLPPALKGSIETRWKFIPSIRFGGDIFDYYWMDDDHFVIYLLDVCGHGVGAALLSVSIMNFLRHQTSVQADMRDPNTVLYIFSDGIYEIFKQGRLFQFKEFVEILQIAEQKNAGLDFVISQVTKLNNEEQFLDDVSIVKVTFG